MTQAPAEPTTVPARRAGHDEDERGDFGLQRTDQGPEGMLSVATSRAAQEVQAAMVVAKRCPRDEAVAYQRIMRACKRPGLAKRAVYAYPRGNTTVSGPSIRLAEAIAQNWGNIDFGIIELEQRDGESTVMSFAWDLETNTRQSKIFTVKHLRVTREGSYRLTDPRDIYEMAANQGARRLRACVLGVVPGDIVEAAVRQCEKTLAGDSSEPLTDRVRKMVAAFDEFGVTADRIAKRLGHRLEVTSEAELVNLRQIYTSLKDNMADPKAFFPDEDEEKPSDSPTEDLAARLAGKGKPGDPKPEPEQPEPEPESDDGPTLADLGAQFSEKLVEAGVAESQLDDAWARFVKLTVGKEVEEIADSDVALAVLAKKLQARKFNVKAYVDGTNGANGAGKEAGEDEPQG